MELGALVASLAATLAPALPYILMAATGAAEKVGEKIADATLDGAKSLWNKIARVENPFLIQAAQEVAKAPSDPDATAALRLQLRKILEADPALRAELEKEIGRQGNLAIASGDGSIAQAGTFCNSPVTQTTHIHGPRS